MDRARSVTLLGKLAGSLSIKECPSDMEDEKEGQPQMYD